MEGSNDEGRTVLTITDLHEVSKHGIALMAIHMQLTAVRIPNQVFLKRQAELAWPPSRNCKIYMLVQDWKPIRSRYLRSLFDGLWLEFRW